jgi:hypothetical protein
VEGKDVWREHFSRLLNAGVEACDHTAAFEMLNFINTGIPGMFDERWSGCEAVLERQARATEILNAPIAADEVAAAVEGLRNGKSPGNELVPSECYRYARRLRQPGDNTGTPEVNRLLPVLGALLEHIRATGDFPEQFTVTLLSPVYKRKGDPKEPGNYRGIAVGGALAKCYASILLRRLIKAGQELGLRHPAQAGFRHGFGTSHHLFVKRHLTEKHSKPGAPPLIIVQIDFEKAFDKVPRELLWMRLVERGVGGTMLGALTRAYERVIMAVKVNGERSEPFESKQGVKQGCPLSTELFGLFIETLADLVDERDRVFRVHLDAAPVVGGRRVSVLLYADDVSLLATTPERMEELLKAVDLFCTAFGMKANVKKCERLVFAHDAQVAETCKQECVKLRLAAEPIPAVDNARYLGLVYGPGRPYCECRVTLHDAARGAMFSLISKLDKLKLRAPDVRMRCFEVQVRSILSYGSEVWGPDALAEMLDGGPPPRRRDRSNLAEGLFEACLRDPMVKLQVAYMRRVVGAARPAHRLLFAELSQLPLHYFWLKQVVGFWNRLVKQPGAICHHALLQEVEDALSGVECWASKLMRVCDKLGVDLWDGKPDTVQSAGEKAAWLVSKPLPLGPIVTAFRKALMAGWEHERLDAQPEAYPSDGKQPGIQMAKYKHWMGLPFKDGAAVSWLPHAIAYMPVAAHQKLMRFRMCCWPLAANRACGRPRHERVCRLCDAGEVEDEQHVLMRCPAYASCREEAQLPGSSMRELMVSADQVKLASLLSSIWTTRNTRIPFGR